MISDECNGCPVCGWCEYDPMTDTIYPVDVNDCVVLKSEKEKNKRGEIDAKY